MNTTTAIRDLLAAAYPQPPVSDRAPLAPLSLAYLGDTVYDLFVRSYLITHTDCTVHGLHVLSSRMVCAAAQARAYHVIEPALTDAERAVFKRGRNAHIGTIPKHATIADYRTATGLETLLGHLALSGQDARIAQLMKLALTAAEGI